MSFFLQQALWPAVGFNVAAVQLAVVPWPKWNTEPPEDDKGHATAVEMISKAVLQFDKAGYDVENLDEIEERYGVKLVKRPAVLPTAPTNNDPPADPLAAE